MKIKHSLFFLLFSFNLFSQTIPQNENKIDKNGFKQGTWTILYDENWAVITNPDLAAYYRIVTYKKGKPKGVVKDYYRDGRLQWEATLLADDPESIEDGKVTWYYENGQKSEQTYYNNGIPEGKSETYYENGQVKAVFYYENGELEGEYTSYYDTGEIEQETQYKDGQLYGERVFYYPNGNNKTIYEYQNGTLNGITTWYNEDGRKSELATFKNGQRDGICRIYYADGSLNIELVYQNGHAVEEQIFHPDGSPKEFDINQNFERAELFIGREDYRLAQYYYLKVLEQYEQENTGNLESDRTYGVLLNNTAIAYKNNFEIQKAAEFYLKSLEVVKNSQASDYYIVLINVLEFLVQENQAEKADIVFNEYNDDARQFLSESETSSFYDSLQNAYLDNVFSYGNLYYKQNQFAKARQIFKIGKTYIDENNLSKSPYKRVFVSFLGVCYLNDSLYAEAEPLLVENAELAKPSTLQQYPVALENLYLLYNRWGKDSLALFYIEEKRETLAKFLTPQNTEDYIQTVYKGAYLNYYLNNYDRGKELIEIFLNTTKFQYGEDSKEYTNAYAKYARFFYDLEDFDFAEQTYFNLREMTLASYGNLSLEYAHSLKNLGELYYNLNRYIKSEEYFLQAISIYNAVSKDNHPHYVKSLYLIGYIKYKIGDFQASESYLLKAQETELEHRGMENTNYLDILNNLGLLYRALGNLEKAEEFLLSALELSKKINGERKQRTAIQMDNLSLVYSGQGYYQKALDLIFEASEITEKNLGRYSISYAILSNNAASNYRSIENFELAEKYFQSSYVILDSLKVPEAKVILASTYNNYADLCLVRNQFQSAEKYFQKSLDLLVEIYGDNHPKYLGTLVNKANLYRIYGKYAEAKELYDIWFPKKITQYNTIFKALSDEEKRQFIQEDVATFENYNIFGLSANLYDDINKKDITENWYNLHLSTKGILLNASKKARQQILNSGNDFLIKKYQDWQSLKDYIGQVANYTLEERQREKINLESLQKQANEMEAELSALSSEFAGTFASNLPTWEQVQNALNSNEVAIEMVRVQHLDTTNTSVTKYAALILTSDSDGPEVVIFDEGDRMETAYLRFYKNIINSQKTGGNREDKNSYAAFWKPIHNKLMEITDGKGVDKIYFSPEKVYNEINVNTLYDTDRQKYVLDDYDIHILTSTREIITMERKTGILPKNGTAYLFGRPDYILEELGNEIEEPVTENISRGSTQFVKQISQASWSDLPGTEKEIKNIAKVFDKKKYNYERKLGEEVTEEAIESLVNPTILHIATHGFFMPTDAVKEDPTQALLQSGLVLSGVTNYFQATEKPNREDGVLTAYEAMNMRLDETSLVVLSACETGTGEVQAGEGVYGLQRALKVAGANTLLMSLWKVNDEATQELMSTFYEEWIRTNDKREAFRNAQLKLREKYPQHYYWGAFVMIGE